ncbi:unnamed protein product [Parajaminaea phylloscopi]
MTADSATTASSSKSPAAASSSSSSSPSSSRPKVLTKDTINPHVLNVEYAVRGALSNKADEYASIIQQGKAKEKGLPFDSIVTANIGNPQQQPFLAQKPITFWRQVAALTEYPPLMDDEKLASHFPKDAIERARLILDDVGSVGAYSHSKGAPIVRRHIKEFIEERDGHPSDSELIYLTSGASGGVGLVMQVLIAGPDDGIMIPIPQYPLYSATLSLHNAHPVPYELDADNDWAIDVDTMKRSVEEARSKGVNVKACCIINPGNPTGACISRQNVEDIIRLAHKERLVLVADEVYQSNIFIPKERPFVSFKQVLKDFAKSPDPSERRIADDVELVSLHSISKGFSGECGRRGGYFELCNFDPEVEAQIYKLASVNLCSSLQGQIGIDLLVKPPREGDESYPLYKDEVQGIHQTLLSRSQKMRQAFAALPGVECNESQGALYLFPEIVDLPDKALEDARKRDQLPDLWYCFQLLEATGICCVPGSGFGKMPQREGKRFWFRTTILAKETDEFVERFGKFHRDLLDKWQ